MGTEKNPLAPFPALDCKAVPNLVSIIIPVYNGANYLREAIDSALAQTWPHCEVLVINDGSTDGGATEAIALSYGERIRYFAKENGGVASALNMGIQHMQGEFFSWLSHDDMYEPHKISLQMAHVLALPTVEQKNICLFTDYTVVNSTGKELYKVNIDGNTLFKKPLIAVFKHMLNGCTALINKQLLLKAGLFQNLPTTQDYDMWFRLARLVPFHHLACCTLYSRHHEQQGFRTSAARTEASQTFIRLLASLTEDEILACAASKKAFFAEIGQATCEVDLPELHNYLWEQASPAVRLLYNCSPKRIIKRSLNGLGFLPLIRRIKNNYLGRP